MSARHRLSKLSPRQGIVYYAGKPWTANHDLWLRSQRRAEIFTLPGWGWHTTPPTTRYWPRWRAGTGWMSRLRRLPPQRGHPSGDPVWDTCVGVDVDRVRVVVEIGGWHRLSGHSIGAYLGLVPTRHARHHLCGIRSPKRCPRRRQVDTASPCPLDMPAYISGHVPWISYDGNAASSARRRCPA